MAKISTYPIINPPLLTDILIGSDVANSNVTKNFAIEDILELLSDYYAAVGTGTAGYVLTSNGAGIAPTWQAGSGGSFVPYTGATTNVNLGANAIAAQNVESSFVEVYESLYIGSDCDINLNGDEGNAGDILLSQGFAVAPIWQTQSTFFANAVLTLPTYASNAAALAGGLVQGQLYASAAGVVSIVL
tara:strand:- start:2116 stop:2679 length:564 start_codon:yes stop_codon:yes gene_type:complete